jgi:hypothetical protein
MLDVAGRVNADAWINIPPYVNDDFVHQFGKLAHQHLGAGTNLNLEYGNEMWNYSFPATLWSYNQAQKAFASAVAKGANPWTLQTDWYAQRLVQVCQIVKGEFGADASRVKCVANTQAANTGITSETLACTYAAAGLGKACGKFFDAVAIAPYFGYYIGNTQLRPTIAGWYTSADGGLSQLFQEITGTNAIGALAVAPLAAVGSGASTGAIGQAKSWMVATKAVLNPYGLPMWAYEGGQHLLPPPGDTDQTLVNLMITANRDARMGAAYQQMLQDWHDAGGQTFTFFTDVVTSTKSGMWGLKENQFDTSAPKWVTATKWRTSVACWWTGC